MNAPDNVARLEHRALKIEAAMDRRDQSDKDRDRSNTDWREATLEMAIELAGARDELKSTQAFGAWLEQRFGARAPGSNNRAILIKWGRNPDAVRALLAETDSRSIQIIDRRLTSPSKSERRGRPLRQTKMDTAFERVMDRKAETGELPSSVDIAKVDQGFSRDTAERAVFAAKRVEEAVAEAKAEAAEAALVASVKFTKAQGHHVEVVVRRRIKEIEKEHKAWLAKFWDQVGQKADEACQKRFPHLQERENDAFRKEEHWREMINKHKPIFTEAEFGDIRMCLHPDNSASKEKRNHAFNTFNIMKLQLTGKK